MWKTCVNADGKIQMKKNGDIKEFRHQICV